MADQKISAVPLSTTPPVATDLFVTVENVGTTPVTKRKEWATLIGGRPGLDGWTPVTGTFAWASASTITISAGGASVYNIGNRLKWVTATGSTQRYGTVVGIADTLLTIAVNTDHVLVNEAWTLPYYSHQESPVGYPLVFNFASAPTNITVGSGVVTATLSLNGKQAFVYIKFSLAADSAITGVPLFTLPFTPLDKIADVYRIEDTGSALFLGMLETDGILVVCRAVNAAGACAAQSDISSTVPMTWAAGDNFEVNLKFLIA